MGADGHKMKVQLPTTNHGSWTEEAFLLIFGRSGERHLDDNCFDDMSVKG